MQEKMATCNWHVTTSCILLCGSCRFEAYLVVVFDELAAGFLMFDPDVDGRRREAANATLSREGNVQLVVSSNSPSSAISITLLACLSLSCQSDHSLESRSEPGCHKPVFVTAQSSAS